MCACDRVAGRSAPALCASRTPTATPRGRVVAALLAGEEIPLSGTRPSASWPGLRARRPDRPRPGWTPAAALNHPLPASPILSGRGSRPDPAPGLPHGAPGLRHRGGGRPPPSRRRRLRDQHRATRAAVARRHHLRAGPRDPRGRRAQRHRSPHPRRRRSRRPRGPVQAAADGMLAKLDHLESELTRLLSALRTSGEASTRVSPPSRRTSPRASRPRPRATRLAAGVRAPPGRTRRPRRGLAAACRRAGLAARVPRTRRRARRGRDSPPRRRGLAAAPRADSPPRRRARLAARRRGLARPPLDAPSATDVTRRPRRRADSPLDLAADDSPSAPAADSSPPPRTTAPHPTPTRHPPSSTPTTPARRSAATRRRPPDRAQHGAQRQHARGGRELPRRALRARRPRRAARRRVRAGGSMNAPRELDELKTRATELADLRGIIGLMLWDQNTMMPPGGAGPRADQFEAIERIQHSKLTDPGLAKLLEKLEPWAASEDPESDDVRALPDPRQGLSQGRSACRPSWRRRCRRATRSRSRSGSRRATARTSATSRPRSSGSWSSSSATSPASTAPATSRIPYDVLLDDYEPGLTTAEVTTLFETLQRGARPARLRGRRGGGGRSRLPGPLSARAPEAVRRRVAARGRLRARQLAPGRRGPSVRAQHGARPTCG